MPLFVSDKGGADFDPIPAGMHHAICYGVVDLGTQASANPAFKPKRQVCFTFELPTERYDFERDGVKKNLPRAISETYTLSLSPKGNLRPMLESWRGRQFTQAELEKFDLEKIIGANCLLNIIHENKNGKIYANVSAISPLMKGTSPRKAENPVLYWSLEDHPHDLNFPGNLPEWLKKKILVSEEVMARSNRPTGATPAEDAFHMAAMGNTGAPGEVLDEEAPF